MKDRQDFLIKFHLTMFDFLNPLGERLHANSATMFFGEIVKNIHDHADGKGKAMFVMVASGVSFVIEDFGTNAYQFEVLKKGGSSKAGNRINFGMGLYLIEGMAKDLEIIDFKIDCSKGFKYSGIYPYDKTPT
jgi:anti-sigma regulatory factor (Ser/Thr protein kinase)